MEPLKDWMILGEIKCESNIVIPSTAKKDPACTPFRVMETGPGFYIEGGKFVPTPVKPGDIIVLDAPLVAHFTIVGREYIAAQAQNIAFRLNEKDLKPPEITPEIITGEEK